MCISAMQELKVYDNRSGKYYCCIMHDRHHLIAVFDREIQYASKVGI